MTQDISDLVAVVERMQKARAGMDRWLRTAEIPESVAAFIEAAADCTAAMRADIERLQRELEAAKLAVDYEAGEPGAFQAVKALFDRATTAERALAAARAEARAEAFREAATMVRAVPAILMEDKERIAFKLLALAVRENVRARAEDHSNA